MRKILAIIAVTSILLASCGSNKPDDKIYDTQTTLVGWVPDGIGNPPKQVIDTSYILQPTWGQANHFAAMRSDHGIWLVIGWLLFLVAGCVVYGLASNAKWIPNLSAPAATILILVLVAGSFGSCKWQAAGVKWENRVPVKKADYDKAIKETGSTARIWEQFGKDCRIQWGPSNCFE